MFDYFKAARESVSMNLIEQYFTTGSRGEGWNGDNFKTLNPFRGDKNVGSFRIRKDGVWIDHALGDEGGDFIDLVAKWKNIKPLDAAKMICEDCGVKTDENSILIKKPYRKKAMDTIEKKVEALTEKAKIAATDKPLPSELKIQEPFKVLGQSGEDGYFAIYENQNIVSRNINNINKDFLTSIATIKNYWIRLFYKITKNGDTVVNWDEAIDTIKDKVRKSEKVNTVLIRRGGCFYDGGRTVFHKGDHLIVDGERMGLFEITVKDAFYASGHLIPKFNGGIASENDLSKLGALFTSLNFRRPEENMFFAGFCLFSRLSPALYWKPNIWLTGAAGDGKTWIIENIAMPLSGPKHQLGVFKWGSPSEAAVRQLVAGYSFPVFIEEAEQRNMNDSSIQKMLMMIRNTSGFNCLIPRGSSHGKGVEFEVPNAFCFASIAVSLCDSADKDRTSVCRYSTVEGSRYDDLEKAVKTLLTDKFCESVRNRIDMDFEIIVQNMNTVKKIMRETMKTRSVDQIAGLIVPGMYLNYPVKWDEKTAREMIDLFDFSDDIQHREDTEEDECFHHFMSYQFMISRAEKRIVSVGECLESISGRRDLDNGIGFTDKEIERELEQFNLLYDAKNKIIRLYSWKTNKIFEKTKWAVSFLNVMERHGSFRRELCPSGPVASFKGQVKKRFLAFDIDKVFSDSKSLKRVESEIDFERSII